MPLKTHQDELPALNLTPMIDVIFNLIIFFMVCTSFDDVERKVDLAVPQVRDGKTLSDVPAKRAINVFRDGRITLDDQPVTLPQLTARLADEQQQYRQLGVTVRGDADGAFQNVAAVLTDCRQGGIAEMGISFRVGTKER